jgi:glycosyltransferase involved in cell wall biosynthesis
VTRYDVCASVVSDLQFDARAWKEVGSLARAGYRVVLIGCRYDLHSTVRRTEDGIDVVEVPLGSRLGRRKPIVRARALVRLWWETARTPARVYHCHNVHPAPAAWFASRIRHGALIYDGHELYGGSTRTSLPVRLMAAIAWSVEAWMVRHSDVVVTTNPSRAAELIRRHGNREVVVLANVPERVDPIQPLDPGFPKGRRILLYQGGIYAGRAFEETIRALVALEDFHFVILGFGRESVVANLSQYAEAHGVRDRLTFLPPRPFSQLVNTAAGATVGIVPVRPNDFSDYTGDTNKLFEYLMAGLPVVVSDLPEMRRVVESGELKVGEFFDPKSPATIVAAVRRVVDDPANYEARRREARRLALEKYNWEIEEVKLLGAYNTFALRPGSTVRKPI